MLYRFVDEQKAQGFPTERICDIAGVSTVADVVVEGELGIVDPDRTSVVGNPLETLAIPWDVLELGPDVGPDSFDVDAAVVPFERGCVEQGDAGHMHVAGSGFEGEERRIQIAERFVVKVTHGESQRLRKIRRCG